MNTLTGKEICDIIKAGSKANASMIHVGGLVVEFKKNVTETAHQYVDYSAIEANQANIAASEVAHKNSNQDKKHDGEYLSTLALENPELYEELIQQG